MEKHKCKLCWRNFANGRALGGHMRSHMMNPYVPPKTKLQHFNDQLLSEEIESASSASEEEEEINQEKRFSLFNGLRENPNRKSPLVNPEQHQLSFAVEAAAGSVVLQDRESETESSKNPIYRRSKRVRTSRISDKHRFSGYNMKESHAKMPYSEKEGKSPVESPFAENEPVSSISDTTPEADVAYCLIMLSRDKWMRGESGEEDECDQKGGEEEKGKEGEAEQAEEEEADHEQQESGKEEKEKKKDRKGHPEDSWVVKATKSRTRGKYRCETCNKVFRSYQALGGHRASHKRIKVNNISNPTEEATTMAETVNAGGSGSVNIVEEKIHECPFCFRVFSSGQALGGHKRTHVIAATASISIPPPPPKPFSRFGDTLIDLNLPAPIDDDDLSQIELSAVSDAEFVNPIKQ